MPEVLEQSLKETVVLAQIEEPAAVEICEEIAAVEGVDGLFLGPADLSVGYGHSSMDNADVKAALARVGDACRANGKGYASFVGSGAAAQGWARSMVSAYSALPRNMHGCAPARQRLREPFTPSANSTGCGAGRLPASFRR